MNFQPNTIIKKSIKVALVVVGWLTFVITYGTMSSYEIKSKVPFLATKSVYTGGWKDGYFTFSGTFDYENANNILYPELNSVSGKCWLPNKTCSIAIASFRDGVLSTTVEILDIVRWDQEMITMAEEHLCIRTVYTATRSTASVTGAEIAQGGEDCNPKHNVKMTLVDGYDVYKKVRAKTEDTPLTILILLSSLFAALILIVRVIRKPSEKVSK